MALTVLLIFCAGPLSGWSPRKISVWNSGQDFDSCTACKLWTWRHLKIYAYDFRERSGSGARLVYERTWYLRLL